MLNKIIGNCETLFSKVPVVQNRQSTQGTLSLHCRSQRCIRRQNTASETHSHFQWHCGNIAPCLRFACFTQLLSWNHAFHNYLIIIMKKRKGLPVRGLFLRLKYIRNTTQIRPEEVWRFVSYCCMMRALM